MQTVLIVDDVRMNRVMMAASLRGVGYRICEAADGVEALRLVRQERPGIVLMDIMMPRMDGISCCRAIKEDPALCRTKVLMVTSRGEADQVKQAFAAGCDGYLIKPVAPEELKAKVAQFARLCAAREDLRSVINGA